MALCCPFLFFNNLNFLRLIYKCFMQIFNTSDLTYTLYYLTRTGLDANSLQITNENLNTTSTYSVTVTNGTNYDSLDFTITAGDFIEGNFYFCKVLDVNSDIVFQDKIFITDQTVSGNAKYDINNGEYTERTTTNDYTIYE